MKQTPGKWYDDVDQNRCRRTRVNMTHAPYFVAVFLDGIAATIISNNEPGVSMILQRDGEGFNDEEM